ncbi:MAG TPA: hypothetical protein IGS52_22605 [Oscillatoriaceae cyanobacterium M33_DOE_052]|uniref:DUF2281 domain-containing protein n=1 Tax=Planktothricoides sp. SpSt-374 TaxID=2282167 RepID=A0A7C4A041_9CYAN|nr:hypothetical protein [Oscillatoriaceae cyanobacterium M33_DOE_052]
MSITELIPTLQSLSRVDKLKVMQFLVEELAKEENAGLQPGATYPVWSPYNSHDAAHKLAKLLEEDREDAPVIRAVSSPINSPIGHD